MGVPDQRTYRGGGPGRWPCFAAQIVSAGQVAGIDAVGVVLLSAGIGALALGLVQSPDWGWPSGGVIGSLCTAAAILSIFVARSARHPSPVLPVRLLRVPGFSPASLCNLLFAVPFAAMLLSIVLWAQQVWHWTPLATGFAVAPGPLMVPPFALFIGPLLVRHIGPALVALVGCVVIATEVISWIVAMGTSAAYPELLPGMLITGIGVGLTLPTLIATAVRALPPGELLDRILRSDHGTAGRLSSWRGCAGSHP